MNKTTTSTNSTRQTSSKKGREPLSPNKKTVAVDRSSPFPKKTANERSPRNKSGSLNQDQKREEETLRRREEESRQKETELRAKRQDLIDQYNRLLQEKNDKLAERDEKLQEKQELEEQKRQLEEQANYE